MPGVLLYDMDNIQDLCERNKHRPRLHGARSGTSTLGPLDTRSGSASARQYPSYSTFEPEPSRCEDELADALRQLPDLTEQERAAVEALSHSMLNRFMHQPLVWLKERSTPEQRELLERYGSLTDQDRMRSLPKRTVSESLMRRARELMPGGVSSPMRAFQAVGGDPVFIDRAEGAYL